MNSIKKELSLEEQMQEIYKTFERVFSEVLKEIEKRNISGLKEKLIQRGYAMLNNDPRTTFKQNNIYFIDFNPISTPNVDYSIERENIDFWNNHPLGYSRHLDEPLHKDSEFYFRINLQKLIAGITEQPIESAARNIFSTNLFFYRTSNETELREYPHELIHCWPFHEQFLKIVKPKLILCNGNGDFSTYSELKQYIKRKYEIQNKKINSSKTIKSFEIIVGDEEEIVNIVGIPSLAQPETNIERIIAGTRSFI